MSGDNNKVTFEDEFTEHYVLRLRGTNNFRAKGGFPDSFLTSEVEDIMLFRNRAEAERLVERFKHLFDFEIMKFTTTVSRVVEITEIQKRILVDDVRQASMDISAFSDAAVAHVIREIEACGAFEVEEWEGRVEFKFYDDGSTLKMIEEVLKNADPDYHEFDE